MRLLGTFLLFLAACLPVLGQANAQHGVQTSDLDRKADPCIDFPEYANGTWHAQNPVPAYMDRWSRRWQAGDKAKERLKDILDETARRTDWPQGSPEQLIGDFYGSCMNEAKINKL